MLVVLRYIYQKGMLKVASMLQKSSRNSKLVYGSIERKIRIGPSLGMVGAWERLSLQLPIILLKMTHYVFAVLRAFWTWNLSGFVIWVVTYLQLISLTESGLSYRSRLPGFQSWLSLILRLYMWAVQEWHLVACLSHTLLILTLFMRDPLNPVFQAHLCIQVILYMACMWVQALAIWPWILIGSLPLLFATRVPRSLFSRSFLLDTNVQERTLNSMVLHLVNLGSCIMANIAFLMTRIYQNTYGMCWNMLLRQLNIMMRGSRTTHFMIDQEDPDTDQDLRLMIQPVSE
ncbi:hypothetical protein 2 [Hubei sobemo-like virus 13]|uniref:hypothetical protein 2 n=1 Tax=Hubei sobemo-like virus 13 TaxID=1923198 RepID=UPI00090AC829|nr:hypothetical protein 2 [Hubei sobemo-like virus 13]APG75954.1 hypothetical protein 2 [Hubei sobemo-like virus 13]